MSLPERATLSFVPMADPVWTEVASALERSWPHACICSIEQVSNGPLRAAYEARRDAVRAARGTAAVREVRVFHGTKAANVGGILREGFRVACNTVSAYGRGTYFATAASLSRSYTAPGKDGLSAMFVCDLIVGSCVRGTPRATTDTALHDNTVDVLAAPTIWTTPYDDGAFPAYLVWFDKNAH